MMACDRRAHTRVDADKQHTHAGADAIPQAQFRPV
jgi:hypothetical protein